MNYKQFCKYAFTELKADYVQPLKENNIRIGAYAVTQHNCKTVACWIPRKGIVWEKK